MKTLWDKQIHLTVISCTFWTACWVLYFLVQNTFSWKTLLLFSLISRRFLAIGNTQIWYGSLHGCSTSWGPQWEEIMAGVLKEQLWPECTPQLQFHNGFLELFCSDHKSVWRYLIWWLSRHCTTHKLTLTIIRRIAYS